jgi:hypothetical protein
MDAIEDIEDVVIPIHNDHGHMISDYLISFFPFKSLLKSLWKEQHLFFFIFVNVNIWWYLARKKKDW